MDLVFLRLCVRHCTALLSLALSLVTQVTDHACSCSYPITLTMWHMFFSGALAFVCVRGGYVPSINMSSETYMKAIVPIGALFAGKPCLCALLAHAWPTHSSQQSFLLEIAKQARDCWSWVQGHSGWAMRHICTSACPSSRC